MRRLLRRTYQTEGEFEEQRTRRKAVGVFGEDKWTLRIAFMRQKQRYGERLFLERLGDIFRRCLRSGERHESGSRGGIRFGAMIALLAQRRDELFRQQRYRVRFRHRSRSLKGFTFPLCGSANSPCRVPSAVAAAIPNS